MDISQYCVAKYEREFGEGSWAKLEKEVRERNPEFFELYDAMPVNYDEQEKPKRWRQFWR